MSARTEHEELELDVLAYAQLLPERSLLLLVDIARRLCSKEEAEQFVEDFGLEVLLEDAERESVPRPGA